MGLDLAFKQDYWVLLREFGLSCHDAMDLYYGHPNQTP